MDHYLEEKKVNIFQYLSSMSNVGVKPDLYVIIFTARRMERCIMIVGLNMVWKSHKNLEHNIILAYLGMCVFVPTEKALGKLNEMVITEILLNVNDMENITYVYEHT